MSEESQQFRLAEWLNRQGVLWVHCPNEGRRSFNYGKKLRAMGLKPGFPDVAIFAVHPGKAPNPVRGWAIELKCPGNRPTPDQRRWLSDLELAGWHVTVAYSAAEAIAWCRREWGIDQAQEGPQVAI